MSDLESGPHLVTDVNVERSLSPPGREVRDLLYWLVLAALGLGLTAWAVQSGAGLGTASAPFLGRYRFQLSWLSLLAPAVAVAVLALAPTGWFDRARWSF